MDAPESPAHDHRPVGHPLGDPDAAAPDRLLDRLEQRRTT